MNKRYLTAALLTCALPFAAVAQTATPSSPATVSSPTTAAAETIGTVAARVSPFVAEPLPGSWRVADLQGKDVYGAEGESIGTIQDVLVTQNGGVNAVVIGVGGFLGIGEKSVAVDMGALQLGPGASQLDADATSRQVADLKAVRDNEPVTKPVEGTDAIKIGEDGLPERIVLQVTRQQLQSAPEFMKAG